MCCWSHVDRNCENQLKSTPVEIRDSILDDIKAIQVMPSTEAYNCAVESFFLKSEEEPKVKDFLAHFKREWIDKNSGWYEGFCEGNIPSTDNLIILIYVNGKYDHMKCDFDSYIEYFRRVRIIKLDKENFIYQSWSDSMDSAIDNAMQTESQDTGPVDKTKRIGLKVVGRVVGI
jgi:hypothetical protein